MCFKSKENKYLEILQKFKEIHSDLYLYDKFTKYTKSHNKIEIFCKKHKDYFLQSVSTHLRGHGCPKCGKDKCIRTLSTEEFIKRSKEIHGNKYNYDESSYTNKKTKVKIFCNNHKEYFYQLPLDHARGRGCKKCGTESSNNIVRKTQESFIEESNLIHNNEYSYLNTKYKNSTTRILITCKKHGDFLQLPYNHLSGAKCLKCVPNISKAEQEIAEILREYFPDLEQSNKKILQGKELDIFIPSKKLAIEYNGLYWHSEIHKDKKYHLDKFNFCREKNIRLIQIFEDEWLYKKEIVLSRLFNNLGITKNSVYARKCEIKEVDSKTSSKFLNDNHIQGKLGAKIRLGLYFNDELVSLMTFGDLRKNLGLNSKEGSFELLRFCNKTNTTVTGGASKLLKYFERVYKPKEIISYADLRWSDGNLYKKLNFEFTHQSEPNYFYTKGLERENRFKYRKSELVKQGYDKNKTEKEIMNELGFNRIYDVGTLKFVKTEK